MYTVEASVMGGEMVGGEEQKSVRENVESLSLIQPRKIFFKTNANKPYY